MLCESAFHKRGPRWLEHNSIITTKYHTERRPRLLFRFCEAVSGEFPPQTGKQVSQEKQERGRRRRE